jgi:hypothetical protein
VALTSVNASAAELLDDFELEVRKLAGVIGVGFSGARDDMIVHISVSEAAAGLAAEEQLPDLLRLHFDHSVACLVEVVGGMPGPIRELFVVPEELIPDVPLSQSPSVHPRAADRADRADRRATPPVADIVNMQDLERVEFIAVNLADDGESVEVHLSLGRRREAARRPGARPKAAAEATIAALNALGWKAPFTVRSAIRLAVGVEGAVIVYLDGPGADRMGISRARSTEEAAVKATLHALNRYLDDPRHQSA